MGMPSALRKAALLSVFLLLHGCAELQSLKDKLPLPRGDITDPLSWAVPVVGKVLDNQLPLRLDASKTFPSIDTLPGEAFRPQLLALGIEDYNDELPPGDYEILVTLFCTQYSLHRPRHGVAYHLGPVQGKAANAIATLLWRGTFSGVSGPRLNSVSWAIQSGTPLGKLPKQFQETIHQLIPDMEDTLKGDYLTQLDIAYSEIIRLIPKTPFTPAPPTLDALVRRYGGEAGELVASAKHQKEVLLRSDLDDQKKEQVLFEAAEQGIYEPVQAEEAPWTEVEGGGAVMRLQVKGGHLSANNILQVRVTGAAVTPARLFRVRLAAGPVAVPFPEPIPFPGSPNTNHPNCPQCLVDFIIEVEGTISYAVGRGAQALMMVGTPDNDDKCPKYELVYEPNGRKHRRYGYWDQFGKWVGKEPVNAAIYLPLSTQIAEKKRTAYDPTTDEQITYHRHHRDPNKCVELWHGFVTNEVRTPRRR